MINYSSFRLFCLICFLSSCRPTLPLQRLKKEVKAELEKNKGIFALAFKDLDGGESLLINEREVFHAASTMKTPVMIEVYKQVNAKKFSLTDSFLVKNNFRSIADSSLYQLDSADDSEKQLYTQIGGKRSMSVLLHDMITVSSNLATNMIIEQVDARNVTQSMRELGARDIQVLRGVEDGKAFEKGLNNTTTAYDLMLIFEKMALGKTVSPRASEEMISILLDQQFNEIIPALLPKEVKVAHKTGSITGVQHDSGIVILPDGRKYVLVILSKNLENEKASIASMAKVSEMIYDFVKENRR